MNITGKSKIPAQVVILGLVSFFTDAATEMLYPLIPVFVSLLGSGAIVIGIIEGVAETSSSFLKFFGGIVSDKTGKRKIFILAGYSISSLVRPFTGSVSSAWNIVFIRLIDRIGKGLRTAPRDALIASATEPGVRGKAYGFHRAMDHAGAVAGPFLAIACLLIIFYFLSDITPLNALRITFFAAFIPGLIAVLIIIFFIKEKAPDSCIADRPKITLKSFDKNFLAYLSVVSLFTLGNSSDAFLLLRIADLLEQSGSLITITDYLPFIKIILNRFPDVETKKSIISIFTLPFFWAFFHILKSALSTPLSALSDRIGRKKVISTGWLVYAFVYAGFAFSDYIPEGKRIFAYAALFAVYSFYYAFTEGTEKALVADIVPEGLRGSAFGAYNFAIGIFALPASVIFGIIYSATGAMYAFLSGAAIALAATGALHFFVREKMK
ncbi:MAG: MFS transporter [Spirochaetota bacterium]